ncbi:MAG: hypothetical protein AAFZ63_02215 [Bacteroidota bacterium]
MLKNLKSLFIVEEDDPKPKSTGKGKASAPAEKSAPVKSTAKSSTPRAGKVTTKFTDILLKAMDEADLDGFDYLEYKKSLKSLQKMKMDEATIYQSAFAMAQTMNATPAHLIETAQHYLKVLLQEEEKFERALEGQQESRIGNKRKEKASLAEQIKAKEQQIQQLQAEIKAHRDQLGSLDKEINEAVASIEGTKGDFIASYQNLTKQIQADVTKMRQYLK